MQESKDDQFYAMVDAMIRFYFKENPDILDDYEYVKRWKELQWLGNEGFLRGIVL